MDEQTRQIIDEGLQDHEKHYRGLCHWVADQVKRRGKYKGYPEWALISDIIGHGSTVSNAFWNKYKPKDKA